jgi:7-cyano-7-deazaguanine synthase
MLLAERALREGKELAVLFFRYAHPAAPQESEAVNKWLQQKHKDGYSIRSIEMNLPLWGTDTMNLGVGTPGPRVLAARNQVMIAFGVNVASSIGAESVWYGANLGDNADYPDCRPDWIDLQNTLASDWGVSVEAPLINMTKQEIKDEAASIELDGWWSCYEPRDGEPCGECNSCLA